VRPDSLEGTAYRPSAWHADGTLEAMEDPTSGFRLAVQWHPEAGDDGRLFDALVAAARQTRTSDARSLLRGSRRAG
jgi:putative glutamine amidotransferase